MKNYWFIYFFLLIPFISIPAQNKGTVKIKIQQADPIELSARGIPQKVGDSSMFEIKGGTFSNASPQYEWSEATDSTDYTHKVTVQDDNNCTASIYVNVKNGSNIEELDIKPAAYPNPTSDVVNIPLPSTDKEIILMIINEAGYLLYKTSVQSGESSYPLTLSTCPAGKYFIQTIAGEDTQTYFVIKK